LRCVGGSFGSTRKQFVSSAGNPSMSGGAGYREEGNGYPSIFNIELDPREELNTSTWNAWVIRYYMQLIGEYQKSLEKCPNPKAVNMTQFDR
jgi:arylsulfatase